MPSGRRNYETESAASSLGGSHTQINLDSKMTGIAKETRHEILAKINVPVDINAWHVCG